MPINSDVQDILNEVRSSFMTIRKANTVISKNLEELSHIDFKPKVSPSFVIIIRHAAQFYEKAFQTLAIIGFELNSGIQTVQQCDLLMNIAKEANEVETVLGEIWNTFWDEKPYENENFILVEDLYSYGRDAAINLSFLDSTSLELRKLL